MRLTWSCKDGGALCECGCMRCVHEDGEGVCAECVGKACLEFKDRAEDDGA